MNKNVVVIFVIELLLLYFIALIVYYLYILNRKVRLENRFKTYTIYKEKEEKKVFDFIFEFSNSFIKRFSSFLYRLKIFNNYSLKYQKYISKEEKEYVDKMDFVSKKVLLSILFTFSVLLYDTFKYRNVTLIQILIAMLFGFYVLDLFMISTNKFIEKRKENDLLRAITIMNNSFKSGHSIMQSIQLVAKELDSPLGLEFKKMYVDLTYGLSLDIVFQRFEKRVKMEEAKYITTSLMILNDTGGDIVKVFESVEKTFFNNKKLNDELKNLTASSKLLYTVLLAVPILFILVIYMLDATYFYPLFSNIFGYIILALCIVLYVSYIIIITRIMKVDDKL